MTVKKFENMMDRATENPEIRPRDFQVLTWLNKLSDGGITDVSIEGLMVKCRACQRTIYYSLKRLKDMGYIAQKRVNGILQTRLIDKPKGE